MSGYERRSRLRLATMREHRGGSLWGGALGAAVVLLTASRAGAQTGNAEEPAPALERGPADVQGARIWVEREADAAACPDQAGIVARVRRYLAEAGGEPLGAVEVHARIEAREAGFTARLVVSGARSGQRTLSAEGPGCDELAEALAVSLALILDGTLTPELDPLGEEPSASLPPVPVAPPAAPVVPSAPPPRALLEAPSARPGARVGAPLNVRGWVGLGGGLTTGVPADVSGALTARAAAEVGRFTLILGGFWAPTVHLPWDEGVVAVRLTGGTAYGCARVVGEPDGPRLDACAAGALGTLWGAGRGYEEAATVTRPWRALGGGGSARVPVAGPVGVGMGLTLLAPLWEERFEVIGAGVAFRSRAVSTLGFAELTLRFL